MSRRQVTAQATYLALNLIDVTVDGPDGSTATATVTATGDIASAARRQAEMAWRSTSIDVDVRMSSPPWLAEGDLVRLTGSRRAIPDRLNGQVRVDDRLGGDARSGTASSDSRPHRRAGRQADSGHLRNRIPVNLDRCDVLATPQDGGRHG